MFAEQKGRERAQKRKGFWRTDLFKGQLESFDVGVRCEPDYNPPFPVGSPLITLPRWGILCWAE